MSPENTMVVVDTSALVRFFTGDNLAKATRVRKLLDGSEEIVIPEAVFVELEYVLMKVYSLPRAKMTEVIKFLVTRANFSAGRISEAVYLYEICLKLSFADCLVVAYARNGKLASFDAVILGQTGVQLAW